MDLNFEDINGKCRTYINTHFSVGHRKPLCNQNVVFSLIVNPEKKVTCSYCIRRLKSSGHDTRNIIYTINGIFHSGWMVIYREKGCGEFTGLIFNNEVIPKKHINRYKKIAKKYIRFDKFLEPFIKEHNNFILVRDAFLKNQPKFYNHNIWIENVKK